jgi:DNA topoisomerase-1
VGTMTPTESMSLAAEAGLHYVSDQMPGFRRVKRGRGHAYLDDEGRSLNGAVRKRIEALAIPPAWRGVWISPDPHGHILATGIDAAGRKQYIYHREWEAIRDEVKFDRMGDFGKRLTRLRGHVDRDLRQPGLSKDKVTALAVAVLDRTLIRIGNRKYANENEAYGLTTLTTDHLGVDGLEVRLEFAGKGGADHQLVFRDRRLAGLLSRCQELDGQTLFSYPGVGGATAITSTDVNLYLGGKMTGAFTAKDFRTWGATASVTESLARAAEGDTDTQILDAMDLAAEKLGNTRQVCRDSYVHPLIPESFRDGTLDDAWRRSRTGLWLGRAESTVNRLIADKVG